MAWYWISNFNFSSCTNQKPTPQNSRKKEYFAFKREMLVILNKERKKEIIRELDWLLETIPCSISLLDKLQVRFAVNTDASESYEKHV